VAFTFVHWTNSCTGWGPEPSMMGGLAMMVSAVVRVRLYYDMGIVVGVSGECFGYAAPKSRVDH